jgi:hypothetical protein
MNRTTSIRRAGIAALAIAALPLLTGCFNPFAPLIAPERGFVAPPPVPSSATGVLRLFEWCYNNRAAAEYRELFTDDYRFFFNPRDSAGADYRAQPWTREDELISTTQLFQGGSAEAPASSITLHLDRNFVVVPDGRYPWDALGRWHKIINTQVLLNIRTTDGNAIDISGSAIFYFVRGDSALIPRELRDRGFGPDSTRWYISRWDDETVQDVGGLALEAEGAGTRSVRLARAGRAATAMAAGETFVMSWGEAKVGFLRLARDGR